MSREARGALIREALRSHLSEREIVRFLAKRGFKCSKTAVHNQIQAFRGKRKSGQKKSIKQRKKLNERAKRHIRRLVRFYRRRKLSQLHTDIQQEGFSVSYSTIRRIVLEIKSLRWVRPRRRQYLTKTHMEQRRLWAEDCLRSNKNFTNCFFADEKWWNTDGPDGRHKMLSDRLDPPPTLPRRGRRNESICLWGAFSAKQALPLQVVESHATAAQYCGTLSTGFLPFLSSRNRTLFHDRDTSHKAAKTTQWSRDHKIRSELFPPKCGDLNPMEHLWGILTARVFPSVETFRSRESMHKRIKQEWALIQQDRQLLRNLANSMPARVRQVVKRAGGLTDF